VKASPLDVVRRGLADVWDSGGRKFVTFEATRREGVDPDRWIQYVDGELNVRWPLDDEPALALPRLGVTLPAGAFPSWHVAGANAAIAVGDVRIEEVARLVVSLFEKIVDRDGGHGIAARVEEGR